MNYTAAMKSIVGTREEQQDCACYQVDGARVFAVVCDGMGGLESGKTASLATITKLRELYEQKDPVEPFSAFFLSSVDILDELVHHLKDKNGQRLGAGTTLVAAAIEADRLFWLSVGDSRLYILRGTEFVQATRDHNYFLRLDQMKQENEIGEREYRSEATRGEALISFIGMGGIEVMDINHTPFSLQPNDTILLTTDGLYKALNDEEIARCLALPDTEQAAGALIDTVNQKARTAQDNTTCIIIKCNEGGPA